MARKLLHVVLFHKYITKQDLKNSSPWYIYVIKAYTKFQQCWCITFDDMNIFLRAIFIFRGLILLLVAETSEQHRYLVDNNYSVYRVHGTQNNQHKPSVSTQKSVWKNIARVLRYWQKCIWVVQIFLLQATKSDHKK